MRGTSNILIKWFSKVDTIFFMRKGCVCVGGCGERGTSVLKRKIRCNRNTMIKVILNFMAKLYDVRTG